MRRLIPLLAILLPAATVACASLGGLGVVQPPRIAHADDRPAEIAIVRPSSSSRLGGATVRLWAEVENPNPFGVMLDRLDGTLFLEEERAARVDFPLGLELAARDEAVVPLDVAIDFDEVTALASVVQRALADRSVGYRIEGNLGVDAGPLGELTFGPMDVLAGRLDASVIR